MNGISHNPTTSARFTYGALASLCVCALLVATSWGDESSLGVPRYWCWLLTGMQVLALWAAGTGRWWGWLLGGWVQLPWIVYAVLTSQMGFVPGCAVSAVVQFYSFNRLDSCAQRNHLPRVSRTLRTLSKGVAA